MCGWVINPAPALATHWQDTLNDGLPRLIESVTKEYIQETQGVFNNTLKEVKTAISGLRSELQQIADPLISDEARQELTGQLQETQESLKISAQVFKDLLAQSKDFSSRLEETVKDLLSEVKAKLNDSPESFQEISKLINSLAEDVSKVNDTNIVDVVSKVSDDVRGLNRSIESASGFLKSLN
jgi:gas vesicle protein